LKLLILERDGVINHDSDAYIKSLEEWIPIPGSIEAIAQLSKAGWTVAVATNQSGIARGSFSEAEYHSLTERYRAELARQGIPIAAVYHCPHHPQGVIAEFTGSCDCRKPAPGMILRAIREHDIDPAASILIGDSDRDLEAGRAAGVGTLVKVGRAV